MSTSHPEHMRAAVWEGEGLTVQTIKVPRPRSREALVKVTSCGVCHTDLHVMKGEVRFPHPAVLGHEISGTVVELGPDCDDTGLAVGSRVVGAFIMPCETCERCLEGRDDLCLNFFAQNRLNGTLYDGESRLARVDGSPLAMYSMAGLAEYSVVPVSALAAVPDGIPEVEAAILGCAVFTAYGAVRRAAEVVRGESVAVVAVGGVGASIIQICKQLGAAPIIAVDIDDEKLAAAAELGADVTINSSVVDPVAEIKRLTGGEGVHVAFEALGLPATFGTAVASLREGGRMIAVGIGAGEAAASVPITPLVRRGLTIKGSFGARTRVDLPAVVALAASGSFDLERAVTRHYDLEEAPQAFDDLAHGRITGRAVVTMGAR